MSLSETEIIQHYFNIPLKRPKLNTLGIGDDAAILEIPTGHQLVTSIDSLNEGIHFPENVSAFDLGHKSLAVSISDIAAMGAEPFSALLALSVPQAEPGWLEQFRCGFLQLANKFNIDLIGGDLCRGSLSITTVVNGIIPKNKAIKRRGAQVGDLVYVTGTLGDAGLALNLLSQEQTVNSFLLNRLNCPQPRVTAGIALRDYATSAIDLSDGLVTDVNKLCQNSSVGAILYAEQLPFSECLRKQCSTEEAQRYALSSGDDYELAFTISPENTNQLNMLDLEVAVTCVGEIVKGSGVKILNANGYAIQIDTFGFDHFNRID